MLELNIDLEGINSASCPTLPKIKLYLHQNNKYNGTKTPSKGC